MESKSLPSNLRQMDFADEHCVAQHLDGRVITWGDIQGRVNFWAKQLDGVSSSTVAVFHNDSVEFLAIVLSLWQRQKIPVIPANTLDSMLSSVKTTTNVFINQGGITVDAKSGSEPSLKTNGVAFIMFTSGSSGAPCAVTKTFEQIHAELDCIEKHWGSVATNTLTLGTVSHHHLYGLIFRLLWPLAFGRPFLSSAIKYFEQLLKLEAEQLTIFASPAHLENMPKTMGWEKIHGRVRAVFSAGSALSKSAAKNVEDHIGIAVNEVYGSTETGVVAQKIRGVTDLWQPLDGVDVKSEQGCLAIKSLAALKDEWFVSKDMCEIVDGQQFILKGRADRIIKVGGKRISASAIEKALEDHPWVSKACIVVLTQHKSRVGAVVQLTALGNEQLVDLGKLELCKRLKVLLEPNIERVAWPRYWRFVADFPVNSEGKITVAELESLFQGEDRPRLPDVVKIQSADATPEKTVHFVVPSNLLYLEGHFPGRPILPGVVQVDWAIHYGRELMGLAGKFQGLEVLKFQQVIMPGRHVELNLQWNEAKSKLTFSYTSAEVTHSSGRIIFSEI